MSAVKSSLRSRVLTPQRIPSFIIPSRGPLLFLSPRLHQSSPDLTGLLLDQDQDESSCRLQTRPRPHHSAPSESVDSDPWTCAAMSLVHVEKKTTSYGFCAALAQSPCSRRRESLFHRNKPVTVTVTDPQDLVDTGPGAGPDRYRICLHPVKALGLQVRKMKMKSSGGGHAPSDIT
ncbi:C2 calcium-dependent domain-containing protein 4C-like [Anarhichas minor]|uniref:C2 calcium-dependent domain-containing protein 4C-like n=1 Tax=Anarhichas minor TaxID=65739 RepID=UPI003F733BE7